MDYITKQVNDQQTALESFVFETEIAQASLSADFSSSESSWNSLFAWMQDLIEKRLAGVYMQSFAFPAKLPTSFASFAEAYQLSDFARLMVLLSFVSYCKPAALSSLINKRQQLADYKGGGLIDKAHGCFLPTLQTLLFLASGEENEQHAKLYHDFFQQKIVKEHIIHLQRANPDDPNPLNQLVRLDPIYFQYLLTGYMPRLDGGSDFPAVLSESSLSFDDVVLSAKVKEELEQLSKYIRNRKKLLSLVGEKGKGKIRQNYLAIFSGEPGTGKTLTATTLGKQYQLPVYVVSLSRVVSKYIGETEKNLEKIFDRLDGKECILFFDEADAMFGKRTEIKEAKDRYANQEVAFLLQRLERYKGIVILASNVNDIENIIDKAFQRRIRQHIKFSFPEEGERLELWNKALPEPFSILRVW